MGSVPSLEEGAPVRGNRRHCTPCGPRSVSSAAPGALPKASAKVPHVRWRLPFPSVVFARFQRSERNASSPPPRRASTLSGGRNPDPSCRGVGGGGSSRTALVPLPPSPLCTASPSVHSPRPSPPGRPITSIRDPCPPPSCNGWPPPNGAAPPPPTALLYFPQRSDMFTALSHSCHQDRSFPF